MASKKVCFDHKMTYVISEGCPECFFQETRKRRSYHGTREAKKPVEDLDSSTIELPINRPPTPPQIKANKPTEVQAETVEEKQEYQSCDLHSMYAPNPDCETCQPSPFAGDPAPKNPPLASFEKVNDWRGGADKQQEKLHDLQLAADKPLHTRKPSGHAVCEIHGVESCQPCFLGVGLQTAEEEKSTAQDGKLFVGRVDPPSPSNPNPMFQGYRELNDLEISRINRIKEAGEVVHKLCRVMADTTFEEEGGSYTYPDQRWIAIAETHLQQGFMALTRAIAKPTSF